MVPAGLPVELRSPASGTRTAAEVQGAARGEERTGRDGLPAGEGTSWGPERNSKNKKTTPSHEARSEDAERKDPLFWASESRAAEPGTTSVAGVHAEHKAQENAEPGARPGLPTPQAVGTQAGGAGLRGGGSGRAQGRRGARGLSSCAANAGPGSRAGAGRARPPARRRPPGLTGPAAVRLPAAGRGERSGSSRSPNRSMTEAGRRLRHTRSPRPAAGSTPCGGCGAAEAAAAAARGRQSPEGGPERHQSAHRSGPAAPETCAGGARAGAERRRASALGPASAARGAGSPPGLLT